MNALHLLEQLGHWGQQHTSLLLWGVGGGIALMGLGNLLLVANSQVNIPLAFACLIGLAVIGIGLYAAVAAVELGLKPWFGDTAPG